MTMAVKSAEGRLCQLLATLLDYPRSDPAEAAGKCAACAVAWSLEAGRLLRGFETFARETPLGRLQEIYSGVFDLDAACHPYVGYHLFGESYKRSVFLLELRKRFREEGFDAEKELPDHLAVLLHFLGITSDATLAREIIHEALLPALERMTGKAKSAGYDEEGSTAPVDDQEQRHPYHEVLEAARLVLQEFPLNGQGRMVADEQPVVDKGSPDTHHPSFVP